MSKLGNKTHHVIKLKVKKKLCFSGSTGIVFNQISQLDHAVH